MHGTVEIFRKKGQNRYMKEIKITDIENVKFGNAQDYAAGTGVTAIICEQGMPCGVFIGGGGPASRETPLLSPLAASDEIHAIALCGGSAFGLDAAGGIMRFLEEKDVGFPTGYAKVPLVCASSIYDLAVGKSDIRPDFDMGYAAAKAAYSGEFEIGSTGVGTGATVGKLLGTSCMMKSGLGAYAVSTGALKIGALICVNALGDVYENGRIICGMMNNDEKRFLNTAETMFKNIKPVENKFVSNTTIGAVITNAALDKRQANKLALMASCGYSRAINPVFTSADGDSIYAASVGNVSADVDVLGTLAAYVVEKAIVSAVKNAESLFGIPCYNDFWR